VDDLAERVHAGVGAAGALRLHRVRRDLGQRGIHSVLHGAAAGLRLPAAEGAAVVFESQSNAHVR